MTWTPTDFREYLEIKGVDPKNIVIKDWAVRVMLDGKAYTVWPTTGKWRDNKANEVYVNIEEFIKLVEKLNSPKVGKKSINVYWADNLIIPTYKDRFERNRILEGINKLIQSVPTGGNYQITVGPVQAHKHLNGKTTRVDIQYFE